MKKAGRTRLDVLLVERGLADSRQKAVAMILAGEVRVDGREANKAGTTVPSEARIEIESRLQRYASRGGLKLEGALEDFGVAVAGRVCVDVGSSTGGFTDCLLQHGAARVYAVDVNIEQLAWKLRQDQRVVAIKRNARELRTSDVAEAVALVVIDVSFISVVKVLAPAIGAASPNADFLILIKPQFELQRRDVGAGGIVRDSRLHEKAIASVQEAAKVAGLHCIAVQPSSLMGAEGNQEFFLYATKAG